MATRPPVKIIYGAESLTHVTDEEAASLLEVAKSGGITDIDTAYLYKNSEKVLGRLNAARDFVIHTKAPGVIPGCMSRDSILDGMKKSLHELRADKVELFYLHTADPATPLEETLSAVQQLYNEGKFETFGISNLSAKQVQELYDHAEKNSFVLPSVYQGNYNPVARHAEKELLPLLRQLGIKFYAYSPLAGGFLAKTAKSIGSNELDGRWSQADPVGQMYHKLYNRPSLVKALGTWERLAQENGLKMAEMAYRWMIYDSNLRADLGDSIIVGSRRASQLEETLEFVQKGPLDEHILAEIENIWVSVEQDVSRKMVLQCICTANIPQAPIDNMQG